MNYAVINEFRTIFRLSKAKHFAILAKALSLSNVSSLSIEIPNSSLQWLDSTVERSIFKLIFSYGLTKKWLLPEFARSPLFLNQANILLMVGSKNSIASA